MQLRLPLFSTSTLQQRHTLTSLLLMLSFTVTLVFLTDHILKLLKTQSNLIMLSLYPITDVNLE